MIISGDNSRSISTQTKGRVEFVASFVTGVSDFDIGLSGNNFFGLSCRGGLVSIDDKVVTSINDQSRKFVIEYDESYYNLSVDNSKIIQGASKASGSYETLVTNSTNQISIESYISGDEPQLTASLNNNSTSGSGIVSGVLTNSTPARRFKIFSAEVDPVYSSRFSVSTFDSGLCSGSCTFELRGLEDEPTAVSGVKLNFVSNFGEFSKTVNVNTDYSPYPEFFTISPNQGTLFNVAGSKRFDISSYFRGSGRDITVDFLHYSGVSGAISPSLESGQITGTISGFTYGCNIIYSQGVGLLSGGLSATGQMSGYVCSSGTSGVGIGDVPVNTTVTSGGICVDYTGDKVLTATRIYQYDVSGVTGNFSVDFSGYYEPTGIGLYSKTISGWATGIAPENGSLVSGILHTNVASHYLQQSGNVYIRPSGGAMYAISGIEITGCQVFSGTKSGQIEYVISGVTGNTNGQFSFIHTGCITGEACITMTGSISGNGSGMYYPVVGTGQGSGYSSASGLVDFTSMWNIKTGIGPLIYDYKNSGWYTAGGTGKFSNSGLAAMPTTEGLIHNPFVEVSYNRSGNTAISVGLLSIYDGYNSGSVLISGY